MWCGAGAQEGIGKGGNLSAGGGWGWGVGSLEVGGKAGSIQAAEKGGGELMEGESQGLGYGLWAPEFWLGVAHGEALE